MSCHFLKIEHIYSKCVNTIVDTDLRSKRPLSAAIINT